MNTTLPELTQVLDEIEFFERERTDRQFVELAILLYDCGVSLRKIERVLGWIGIERSHVATWTWVQKFGQRLSEAGRRPAADLPAVVLLDETGIKQHGEEFTLFAAVETVPWTFTQSLLQNPREAETDQERATPLPGITCNTSPLGLFLPPPPVRLLEISLER